LVIEKAMYRAEFNKDKEKTTSGDIPLCNMGVRSLTGPIRYIVIIKTVLYPLSIIGTHLNPLAQHI